MNDCVASDDRGLFSRSFHFNVIASACARASTRDATKVATRHRTYTFTLKTDNMPPKKGKKQAAVVAKPTRSTSTAVPPTVTTNRGKDYDTTAAAARPRRAPAPTSTVAVKSKTIHLTNAANG